MSAVRRVYIYLVSVVSLESVTWAIIALLRNLLAPGKYTAVESTAFQIAVIVIGLPIYLVHWLWAQRLAGREPEERGAVLRCLYLYGVMAGFIGPFLANAVDLLDTLMRLIFGLKGQESYRYLAYSQTDLIIHAVVAMGVTALLWLYHRRVLLADHQAVPESGHAATVRRLYVYGFSAAGLGMTALALVSLLRWVMFQVGGGTITVGDAALTREVARLAVGLPLWLIFWSWAQRLFAGPDEEERASVLRQVYLYLAIFLSAIASITAATYVLAGFFRRVLGVRAVGREGDIREALSIIVVGAIYWAYHAYTLRRDAQVAGEQRRQAWVRQLYHYLVAGIGLAACLVGLSGLISFLIRFLSGVSFITGVPGQVAWFSAALVAGLPVWIIPWRQVQIAATAAGPSGDEESGSLVRKIYLYFFLLVATMTVLSSGVYIVYQLVSLALGGRGTASLGTDLAQAIAFSLIAVGVWLYHGSVLRADSRRAKEAQAQRLSALRVAVMDAGDGSLGRVLLEELQRELPGLNLQPLGLTAEASAALGTSVAPAGIPAALAESDLIVGPWTMAVAGPGVSAEIAQAVAASPAHKVLIPTPAEGWHWVGLGDLKTKDAIRYAVRAVKQVAAGEEVRVDRGLSAGAIAGIVFGALILLLVIAIPLVSFFAGRLF